MDFKIERLTRSEIESLMEDRDTDSETESDSDAVPGSETGSDSDNSDASDAESMTLEEVNAYIGECMEEYFKENGVNMSLELKKEAEEVEDDLRFLYFEYLKKKKASQILHRNQVKFLRHMGMLPKPETASAEVSADFPIDLDAFRYYAEKYKFSKGQKFIVDVSDMKQYTPTIKYATNTAPVKIKQEPDSEPSFTFISATETNPQSLLDPNIMVKVECIDLTDETDEAPVTIVKTPVKFFKKPAKVVKKKAKVVKKKAKVVKEPAKVVKKKAKVIETPVKFVETPVEFVETPVKFVETPVEFVETPAKIVERPAKIVETPMQPNPSCSRVIARAFRKLRHPAPLPPKPFTFCNKYLPSSPPKPSLSVCVAATGIILKWEMPLYAPAYTYAKFDSYELFWYEELQNMPVDSQLWKSMGFVQSLPLPMACTLTMFRDKTIHHFAVRAMDIYKRYGDFSNPVSAFYKEEK